ncbi:hypothetical protein [Leisingera sp. JC11]|uniref:hypothetical protein n=1 Tax=Leisingera sp. JC11 TaxID=3042469 RepID=UPI0034513481
MKVCVVGNSHCGALIEAWRQICGSWADLSLTFFATPGTKIRNVALRDGKLVGLTDDVREILKVTSGGLQECDPEQYDSFLFYGLIKSPKAEHTDVKYSAAVREAALTDRCVESNAARLIGQLRTVTDKPVSVAAAPFRVPAGTDTASAWTCSHEEETAFFQRVAFDKLSASVIAQPKETVIGQTRATFAEFSTGSKRLQVETERAPKAHPSGEVSHMNCRYGEIWLEHYLPTIRK